MKNTWLWQLGGWTFTAVLGTLLHFLFDWAGCLALTPISAVNESTWEHMKILFFPMLFFAILQSVFVGKSTPNFWWIKLLGITLGTLLIPILFYTLGGVFGKTPGWVNVLIFFLSAGKAYLVECVLFQQQKHVKHPPVLAVIILIVIAVLFIVFTYAPPPIPLFQDPISRAYGIR